LGNVRDSVAGRASVGFLRRLNPLAGGLVVAVRFRVLGPVEMHVDGALVDAGHARQRCVLVALLVDANRAVPVGVLLDRVWGDRPPQRARNALAGYLSRLRRVFGQQSGVRFAHRPEGYQMTVDLDAVDMHRFRRLVAGARAAEGDRAVAELLDEALRLWRGEAFTALGTPWLAEVRVALDADRWAATLDRNEVWLRLGRHAELLGELSRLAGQHPLDERLAAQLMLAQYRCDRQADALRHYEFARARLADELGVDPGPSLRALHQRILTADPALAAPSTEPPASGTPVPRQLPAPPALFVGRAPEVAALDAALAEPGPGMVVHLITGTARRGQDHTRDVLGASGGTPVRRRAALPEPTRIRPGRVGDGPGRGLRVLLDSLGVPAKRIPSAVDAQSALLRSLRAGKRVLMVLDNVRDTDQVRPLLPGTAACAVVITSRVPLAGLVVGHGARQLNPDVLSHTESRDLIAARIGRERVAAEPEAVAEIVARCARLPLALAIVAARVTSGITLHSRRRAR
jgi:DNA-binding SARP family transcriptional activator